MAKDTDYSLKIPSSTEYLDKVEKLCVRVTNRVKMNESDADDVAIAVTELVNNAIHHGNKDDQTKFVHLNFAIENNLIRILIRDEGPGFVPEELGDPLAPENLMKESGRGIFLIENLMDSVEFNFTNGGTEVIITKQIVN